MRKKGRRKEEPNHFPFYGEACVWVYRKVAAFLPITAKQHSFLERGLGSTEGIWCLWRSSFYTKVWGATSEHLLFSIASGVVVK